MKKRRKYFWWGLLGFLLLVALCLLASFLYSYAMDRHAFNSRAREPYQLWVFDGARDERYPVDGGVFDIPAGQAEVIVPIHARLGVAKPMLFAVTVEKPGGVVVSSRERIVVLAQLAST